MTITLDITTQGLRESNIVGLNSVITDAQRAEALARLQSLVASVYGKDVGENLVDWPIGKLNVSQAWPNGYPTWTEREWRFPRTNTRLLFNADGPQDIYLPKEPDDGSRVRLVVVSQNLSVATVTLHGNGRLIEGSDVLVLNDDTTAGRVLMYDADSANWVRVTDLTLESDMPFPIEFDDYFITKLAMRLNPRYGRALTAESANRLNEITGQLKARYRQKQNMPADPAVLRITDPGRYGFMRGSGRNGWMS